MKGFTRVDLACLGLAILFWTNSALSDVWTLLPADPAQTSGARLNVTPDHKTRRAQQQVRLDADALDQRLAVVGQEFPDKTSDSLQPVTLALPTPDGSLERFAVLESPVVEPGLALWLTDRGWPLRTFTARSLDRPDATARLDWGGPNGFHAVVLSSGGTYYVDPETPGDFERYVSYYKRDNHADQPLQCEGQDFGEPSSPLPALPADKTSLGGGASTGGRLRPYRRAYAVAGDYTQRCAGGSGTGLLEERAAVRLRGRALCRGRDSAGRVAVGVRPRTRR